MKPAFDTFTAPSASPSLCRVVLVEDNAGDARLVSEMLADAGAEVALTTHTHLQAALQDATAGMADLVLLDLSLPDAHGLEGLRRLRAAAPSIPVVVLSGLADDAIAMEAVGLGAQDYLVKGDVDGTRLDRAIRYALERKRAELRLAHMALHDPLTGLPNRVLLADRLEHALARRSGGTVTLLFLDLDGFKAVNDAHGHAAGDELLVTVADRLRELVRAADTIARFGGDEFTVLCEDVNDTAGALVLARRLTARLGEPYELSAATVEISAAIGIAMAHEDDPTQLLQRADAAMYQAKRAGRGQWSIAQPSAEAA